MKTLLSVFDYSGNWSAPFSAYGWEVIQWDIKLCEFMDIDLINSAETALEMFESVDGILAAPPCTHFALSGAQYWHRKDLSGITAIAVEWVNQVLRLVDLFTPTDPDFEGEFLWAIENPVGRIGQLCNLGKPWYFHPYEFAGWLPDAEANLSELERIRAKKGYGVTDEEADLVVKCNAYQKKTGLWGNFKVPEKRAVEPVRCAPQGSFTQRYGGKSEETKEARSNTPMGFAHAFCEANKNYL